MTLHSSHGSGTRSVTHKKATQSKLHQCRMATHSTRIKVKLQRHTPRKHTLRSSYQLVRWRTDPPRSQSTTSPRLQHTVPTHTWQREGWPQSMLLGTHTLRRSRHCRSPLTCPARCQTSLPGSLRTSQRLLGCTGPSDKSKRWRWWTRLDKSIPGHSHHCTSPLTLHVSCRTCLDITQHTMPKQFR
jgi:hypothetical protein